MMFIKKEAKELNVNKNLDERPKVDITFFWSNHENFKPLFACVCLDFFKLYYI